MRVAFYVSGHGYGHAARMGEVMRALRAHRPGVHIFVRSSAPAHLFPEDVHYSAAEFEPGLGESADALRILRGKTAALLAKFFRHARETVAREAEWMRANRIKLLVGDIPFLAGPIAAAAGAACVGISNFTWDWIYEPHLQADPRWPDWERRIRDGYASYGMLLKLPFAQSSRLDPFPRVVDVPLIGRRGVATAANGSKRRVLVGMRAAVARKALRRAMRECPEFEFVEPYGAARFQDLVASSAVVISKLGYSTVAECVVNRIPLLYPPRQGFREDAITRAEAAAHIPLAELPLQDYRTGAWAPHLRAIASSPVPVKTARADGAEICARLLSADGWGTLS